MNEQDRKILEIVRTALLMLVDAVERKLEMPERTSDIRKRLKESVLELARLRACQTTEI